jgi:hypothetical protein
MWEVRVIKRLVAALASLGATAALGGELVQGATVIEVASTYLGGPELAVRLAGGIGVCGGTTWIIFPESKAASVTSHKQVIATALLAFSMQKKVRIHNFQDNSCTGANFISVSD